jgi:hypothetical protein
MTHCVLRFITNLFGKRIQIREFPDAFVCPSRAAVKNGGGRPPLNNTSSWRGTKLSTRTTLLLPLSLSARTKKAGRVEIAHSVQRLTTGWTTEVSEFESRWRQESSLLHVVQTGSGAHPASYPTGTEDSFPEGKAAWTWSWPLPTSAEVKKA